MRHAAATQPAQPYQYTLYQYNHSHSPSTSTAETPSQGTMCLWDLKHPPPTALTLPFFPWRILTTRILYKPESKPTLLALPVLQFAHLRQWGESMALNTP